MIGRRFISLLRRNPIPSSSAKVVAEDEAKPKAWGRRIVSGGLICVTGGVALSALDDLVIYHGCSRLLAVLDSCNRIWIRSNVGYNCTRVLDVQVQRALVLHGQPELWSKFQNLIYLLSGRWTSSNL